MTTILLTRPRASSESFAEELKRHGYQSVIEPLLTITPLMTPRPGIQNVRAVIITSRNALEAMEARKSDIAALFDIPCFCVGSRTGERARIFGFRNIENSAGDGIELARLIKGKLADKGGALLHISGKDIDSKAGDALRESGYEVIVWPVYGALPATRLTDEAVSLFRQQKLDVVTVFSVRTAQILSSLLELSELRACCGNLTAIGLSEAVADALRPLPWLRLMAADTPTEDAVIKCLKQFCPVP